MRNILTTDALEEYINKIIVEKLKKYNKSSVKYSVKFEKNIKGGMDGEYVYSSSSEYHYIFLERGRVENEKKSNNLFDITYWSLEEYLFDLAMDYTKKICL